VELTRAERQIVYVGNNKNKNLSLEAKSSEKEDDLTKKGKVDIEEGYTGLW